jgi:hypothetical protein
MYKPYLKVKASKTGSGVFTSVRIPARAPVLEFKGDLFEKNNIKHDASQILQIGQNSFMGPSGDIDDYINHSCDPNCGLQIVGNRAILYSLYDIAIGSEVTFDYSTSSTDSQDEWTMECKCGSIKCRKTISGIQYLGAEVLDEYKKKGVIPLFLSSPMFMKK